MQQYLIIYNIPQYKSNAYIYLLIFFLFFLIQVVTKVTMDTTVMLYVLSLHTVRTVSQNVTVQRQIAIMSTGVQDKQRKSV